MRTSRALGLGVAFLIAVTGSRPLLSQDPVKVAPKNVKVVFENNRVRVLEVRIKPGEKIPMHSHPPHLVYTLSDFKGKYSSPDGESTLILGKTGAWSWTEAITHDSENVGTTEIHAFAIELKEPPKRKAGTSDKPAATKKN
jgi:quercetin dioxygenase-like cupin family protein